MKTLFFAAGVCLISFLAGKASVSAEEAICPLAPARESPFLAGEAITYDIKKLGIKVGEASLVFHGLTRKQGREFNLITFTASGPKFFDEEKIFVDPGTFYPQFVERDLNIFGKKERITEEYFPDQGQIKTVKEAGGKITEQMIEKAAGPGQIDNIYGFLYRYRRTGTFEVGEQLSLNLPTKDVVIELIKEEKLEVADQELEAYYLESAPKEYKLWFGGGRQKIPLRIDGAMGFLSTSMILSDYQETYPSLTLEKKW